MTLNMTDLLPLPVVLYLRLTNVSASSASLIANNVISEGIILNSKL